MIVAGDPNDMFFCSALETKQMTAPALTNLLFPKANAVSLYQVFNQEQEKETFFEAIRTKHYPDAPSRLGAIFLFPDKEAAARANMQWWNGSKSLYMASTIFCHSQLHADSAWLNCSKNDWEECAHAYFSGKQSNSPLVEIVFVGIVQINPDKISNA